jgi:hypothetical protein
MGRIFIGVLFVTMTSTSMKQQENNFFRVVDSSILPIRSVILLYPSLLSTNLFLKTMSSLCKGILSIVEYIRHEYSQDSTKDWKNTLTLLASSSILLLLALGLGRQLFHSSSSYYALLHRGDEQDIVNAVAPKKEQQQQQQLQQQHYEQGINTTTKPTTTTSSSSSSSTEQKRQTRPTTLLHRSDSTVFQVPLIGFVSFSSSWDRRKQTIAMFTCSLAFVLPMTLACWMITIYWAIVVPLQHRQVVVSSVGQNVEQQKARLLPMFISSLVWTYLLYIYLLDQAPTTGNRTPWMRGDFPGVTGKCLRQWWSWACDFLPVILVKTADLPATTTTIITGTNPKDGKCITKTTNNKYVLGYHPHGIIAVGAFCAFSTDGVRVLDLSKSNSSANDEHIVADDDNSKHVVNQLSSDMPSSSSFSTPDRRGFSSIFPGLDRRVVTLPQNFYTPFLREYFLWMGAITSSKSTFRQYLQTFSSPPNNNNNHHNYNNNIDDANKQGLAMIVVVGGAAESLMAEQGSINLVLRNRRGFVREAIMAGAHLVPVLGFGETNLYHLYSTDQKSMAAALQRFVKRSFGFGKNLLVCFAIYIYISIYIMYDTN